jgi:hypothetical protein
MSRIARENASAKRRDKSNIFDVKQPFRAHTQFMPRLHGEYLATLASIHFCNGLRAALPSNEATSSKVLSAHPCPRLFLYA